MFVVWIQHLKNIPKPHLVGSWCRAPDCCAEDRGLHTQGLKITEENVLPLPRHLQVVKHFSPLG